MSKYLLEIGTEELPAKFADSVVDQLKSLLEFELEKNFIKNNEIFCSSTPRRIFLLISGLNDLGKDKIELRKGPKADAAFLNGVPTNAAIGFAKSLDLDVKDLLTKKIKNVDFVFGEKIEKGKSTKYLLSLIIPKVIKALQGSRFMKWSYGNFKFSRPIRWIISLYNDEILEFNIDDIEPQIIFNNFSRGHRLISNKVFINHPDNYLKSLEASGVLADRTRRKKIINDLVNKSAHDLRLYPDLSDQLLNEITDLVESPDLLVGNFDNKYLTLPTEVLCTVMKNHQRYVPLFKANKKFSKLDLDSKETLSTKFFLISNGLSEANKSIKKGNENVLKARFADAKFFIEADLNLSCNDRNKKISSISYLKGLGNIAEKVERIIFIANEIFNEVKDSSINIQELLEAAKFSKQDLCSEIVKEFPELQGTMGGKYLMNEGFSKNVSLAVSEHYFPRFYKDNLPSTKYGSILAISDKLETIISIFVIGKRPSGSSDPYALRRNLNGIIQIIWQNNFDLKFDKLIAKLIDHWHSEFNALNINHQKILNDLIEFSKQRIISHLEESSYDKEIISSTCESENIRHLNILDIADLKNRIETLQKFKLENDSASLINIISRYTKLANKGNLENDKYTCEDKINIELFEKKSEIDVFNFLQKLENLLNTKDWEYHQLINLFQKNTQILFEIFDNNNGVLVMTEDLKLRNNRLNLLALVRNYSLLIADFTLLNS